MTTRSDQLGVFLDRTFDLQLSEIRVLAAIARKAKGVNRWAEYGQEELAERIGLSASAVTKAVKRLRQWGYIEARHNYRRAEREDDQQEGSSGGRRLTTYRVIWGESEITYD